MPTAFDCPTVGDATGANEHAAAMFAEAHPVEHGIEEARKRLERRQTEASARHGEQVEDAVQNLGHRSEEHTSELQSLMRISYAVFCLKKKRKNTEDDTLPKKQRKQKPVDNKCHTEYQ